MENRRFYLSLKRGTIAIGALTIVGIFMVALSSIVFVVMEYSRYAYAVKSANELVAMRVRENLKVKQISSTEITVTNDGSTSSLIIGIYIVNGDKSLTYWKLDKPVTVKVLSEKTFPPPQSISEGLKVGVLTSLGNVFWEENE